MLVVFLGVLPRPLQCQSTGEVGRTQAIYLRKVLEFVRWPAGATEPKHEFRICVAGSYAISYPLAEEFRATQVEGRRVEVQLLTNEKSPKTCQVVFFSSIDARQRARVLEAVKGTQILTVGDGEGFLEAGGILRFGVEGGAMQFEVNLGAAKCAGLKIDARLLSMAHRVVTERGGSGT